MKKARPLGLFISLLVAQRSHRLLKTTNHAQMGIDQVQLARLRMNGSLRREHARARNLWNAQLRELTRFDHANPESRIRILGHMRQLTNEAMHQRIDEAHQDAVDDFFEQFRFSRTRQAGQPRDVLVPETPQRPMPPLVISDWTTPIDQVSDSEWQFVDDLEENPRPAVRRRLNFDTPTPVNSDESVQGTPQEFEHAMLMTPLAAAAIDNAAAYRRQIGLDTDLTPLENNDQMPSVFDEVNQRNNQ